MQGKKAWPQSKTYQRNWLDEAFRIHKGDMNIKVKREHVIESINALMLLTEKTEKLNDLVKRLHDGVQQKLAEKGKANGTGSAGTGNRTEDRDNGHDGERAEPLETKSPGQEKLS